MNVKSCFLITLAVGMLVTNCGKKSPVDEKPASGDVPKKPDPVTVPANPFPLVGYAVGTTGGQGGSTVTASSFNELKSYLESSTAYIVKIDGRIYNGTKGARININSNKTLLGVGSTAFLDGIGLNIGGKTNIIIQNIKFTLVSITDKTDPAVYDPDGDEGRPQIIVNGGDCISINGTSSKIWVDHCEFYQEDPAIQTNQDLYDGLIDVKNGSANITISWNYFHDHHKTHLIGSSDTDNFDRRITFHHNYYKNAGSRLPSYRFGSGHVYNNFYQGIKGSGVNSRMGACIKVENNVFETVKSPIITDGAIAGKHELVGNLFSGITGIAPPATSTCTLMLPYTYTADDASIVKAEVTAKAGVGKL